MTSHVVPSATPVIVEAAEDLTRVRRGMWVATACAVAAAASAAIPVVIILTTLEYDFDNGLLAPFAPVWRPAVLLAFALAWPVPVFVGRPLARWVAALGLAIGAAWLLFLADLDPRWLRAALLTAACWSASAVALAVLPSIGAFSRFQRAHARTYAHHLGTLHTEADARRWISVARAWEEAGVLARRDRLAMNEALRGWAGAQAAPDAELVRAINALAPLTRGWRLPERLRRRSGSGKPGA